MIPVRGDVPVRGLPLVVVSLIAVNLLVFLHEITLGAEIGSGALDDFVESWGLVPREFLRHLADPGATGAWIWLTPITAMFIHGGLLHLSGNLVYLWVFGTQVEGVVGHGRFVVLYFACGLAATAAQIASAPTSWSPMLGASGAVSGVLGAALVSYPGGRLRLLWPHVRIPTAAFLGLWIVIQIMSGLDAWGEEDGGVAWWAHVGGFAAGIALGRAMWVRKPTRSRVRI